MKKVLLLMVSALLISSVAMATPHYGVYSDCTGTSCSLAVSTFSNTNALVEKFSTGTTGCRLKVDVSGAPGTTLFGFNTAFVPIGNIASDLSLGYGVCLNGTTCLGTLLGAFQAGTIQVTQSDGFPNIIYTDCNFGELVGKGGKAYVGTTGNCNEVPTQPSTWGQVKALYR